MKNQEGKLSSPNQNRRFLKFVNCAMSTVKCDSQVAFKSHLTGKKHLANLKQFHSHHALYEKQDFLISMLHQSRDK